MPHINANNIDARYAQTNNVSGSQYNYGDGSVHNEVNHNDYSTHSRNQNTYSTASSTDRSWRPTYNTGDTYYSGIGAGSTIKGNMNINVPRPDDQAGASAHRVPAASRYDEPGPTPHGAPSSGPPQSRCISSHQQAAPDHSRRITHGYQGTPQEGYSRSPASNIPRAHGAIGEEFETVNNSETYGRILPVPVPIAAARTGAPDEKLRVELQQLETMGFTNMSQNIKALKAAGGNVESAVDFLLAEPQ